MSTQYTTKVCEQHGNDMVVYQVSMPRLHPCPLCRAEMEVADLRTELDDVDGKLDALQEKLDAADAELG